MGKKKGMTGKRKAAEIDEENNDVDLELEAEMQALAAIRAEKSGQVGTDSSDEDEDASRDNEEEQDEDASENSNSKEEKEDNETNRKSAKRARGQFNKEALSAALESMRTNELSFVEKMEICEFEIGTIDENDDLQREMEFYNQTVLAVDAARKKLKAANVPYRRPADYFAESVKSDTHMGKAKERLIHEQKKIEAYEMRRQRETNRKYNKQLQLQKKMEHGQKTKEEIEAVKKLRSGAHGGEDEEGKAKLEKILKGRGIGDRGRTEKSQKRKNMDKKYGSGTKEKMRAKLNSSKSLNDFSDYSPRGGKFVKRGAGGPAKGGKKSSQRPGKSKRDAKRAGK